jgi:hypothetical protein
MSGDWADSQGHPISPETLLTVTFEEIREVEGGV